MQILLRDIIVGVLCTAVHYLFICFLAFLFLQKCLIVNHPFGKQKGSTMIILKVSSFGLLYTACLYLHFFCNVNTQSCTLYIWIEHNVTLLNKNMYFHLFPGCSFDREPQLYADDTCVVPEKLEGKADSKNTEFYYNLL